MYSICKKNVVYKTKRSAAFMHTVYFTRINVKYVIRISRIK